MALSGAFGGRKFFPSTVPNRPQREQPTAESPHAGYEGIEQAETDAAADKDDAEAVQQPLRVRGYRVNGEQVLEVIGHEDGNGNQGEVESGPSEIDGRTLGHLFAEQEKRLPKEDDDEQADEHAGHDAGQSPVVAEEDGQSDIERGLHDGGAYIFVKSESI